MVILNTKNKLYIIYYLTTFLLIFGFTLSSNAQESDRVFDEANLFSESEKQTIENQIEIFENENQMALVIVTTIDTNGKTTEAFADDFYDSGDYGFDSSNSGALFAIDMQNRTFHLSTTGYMRVAVPDKKIKTISSTITPQLSSGDYAGAITLLIDTLDDFLKEELPTNIIYDPETDQVIRLKQLTVWHWIIASVAGIIASVGFYYTIFSKYNLSKSEYRYPYLKMGNLNLTKSDTQKTMDITTHRRIQKPPSSGGGHIGSSGRSHGGGGGRF